MGVQSQGFKAINLFSLSILGISFGLVGCSKLGGPLDVTLPRLAGVAYVSGSVSGMLPGREIVLQLEASSSAGSFRQDARLRSAVTPEQAAAGSTFRFDTPIPVGASYSVRILAQPASPEVACQVVDGQGTLESDVTSVSVVCPTLRSLQLGWDPLPLPAPGERDARLDAVFSDGSVKAVTPLAAWSSSAPAVASVDAAGKVRALSAGTARITATFEGLSASGVATITAVTLRSLVLSPSSVEMPIGGEQGFVVTGVYSDASTADLTARVEMSSSQPSVASFESDSDRARQGVLLAHKIGRTSVTATDPVSGLTSAAVAVAVTSGKVEELQVGPPQILGWIGGGATLSAHAVYADQTVADVTGTVSWESSSPKIASVSETGVVSFHAEGKTKISASYQGQSAVSVVAVGGAKLRAIELTPAESVMPVGFTQRLRATARLTDGSSQDITEFSDWSVSDARLASVSNESGLHGQVLAIAKGKVEVVASLQGVKGVATLKLAAGDLKEIRLDPPGVLLPRGVNTAFRAYGTFSEIKSFDVTDRVKWLSSNPKVATISNVDGREGELTHTHTGPGYAYTDIRAAYSELSSATVRVVSTPGVLTELSVNPSSASLRSGTSRDLVGLGRFSDGAHVDVTRAGTWRSEDPAVFYASNASPGRVTGLSTGGAAALFYQGGLSTAAKVSVSDRDPEAARTQGTGLLAQYYSDRLLKQLVGQRLEHSVNYDWDLENAPLGLADQFSVRWSGQIEAPASGDYTFYTSSDDGVRLWVDGKLLIDQWNDHARAEHSAGIRLEQGRRYEIRLEFYENLEHAVIQLRWQGPGFIKQLVPTRVLYPASAGHGQ